MNDRRSFLKLFGAGAVVAPIIGGIPDDKKAVQLAETPKIELATTVPNSLPFPVDCFVGREALEITLYARDNKRGKVYRLDCDSFITEFRVEAPEVCSWNSPLPQRIAPLRYAASFAVTGDLKVSS